MRTATKKPRGRPRKPANTALVQALIDRQDALSRRRARELRQFWDEYLDANAVRASGRMGAQLVVKRVLGIPDRLAEAIAEATDSAVIRDLLAEDIRRTLDALVDELEQAAGSAGRRKIPSVRRSRTLAGARAQSARLHTQLMQAKGRVLDHGVVPLESARRSAFEKARTVRDNLQNIPARQAMVLAAPRDVAHVRQVLAEEIRGALEILDDDLSPTNPQPEPELGEQESTA